MFKPVVCCEMSTGGSKGHEYRSVSLAAVACVPLPGHHVARLQYKVLFGECVWAGEPAKAAVLEGDGENDDDDNATLALAPEDDMGEAAGGTADAEPLK